MFKKKGHHFPENQEMITFNFYRLFGEKENGDRSLLKSLICKGKHRSDIKNPSMEKEKGDSIKHIVRRIDAIKNDQSSNIRILEKRYQELLEEKHQLYRQAKAIENQTHGHISNGNATGYENNRRELKRLNHRHDELKKEEKELYNQIQIHHLRSNMKKKLGSWTMVYLLDGLIIFLIIVVLVLIGFIFFYDNPAPSHVRIIYTIDTLICGIFLLDFFFRLSQADSKKWYWKRYWLDFITSLPLPNARILRFGRILRLTRLLRVLRFARLMRLFAFVWRGLDKLSNMLDVRLMKKSLKLSLILLFIGALIIYWAEGAEYNSVDSMVKSLWWSFTTLITGGFGDLHNPHSPVGKTITIILIISGIVLVGIFTAVLTSLLVEDESNRIIEDQKDIKQDVEEIKDKMEL